MKAAIIGTGFIANLHAEAYQDQPQVQLSAVCDIDEFRVQAMTTKYGCAAYTNGIDMLEEVRPDLVSICVPTWLHEQYTVAALKRGAHVLCEKPMALTLEACEAMAQAARDSGRVLMTGQVLRWWPGYTELAHQISRLGQPFYVKAQRLQHASRGGWFHDPVKGGGVLFDLLVHDLDFTLWVMKGTPHLIAANGTLGDEGSWRRVSVSLGWDGGSFAQIDACNMMPPGYPFTASFMAQYEKAALEYTFRAPLNIGADEPSQSKCVMFENGKSISLPVSENAQTDAFRAEIAAFVRGVDSGVSPLPFEETLRVMRLVHEIKEMLEISN